MVARRPIVVISGKQTELPPGDTVTGASVGSLTAGSGLYGGGDLSKAVRLDVALAPNPSGIIFVGEALGIDGAAQVLAETVLSSGNYSLSTSSVALASGDAAVSLANTALASGNAALADIAAIPGGTYETFTAASAIASGYAVGLDDLGKVQALGILTNNSNNFTTNTLTKFYTGTQYDNGGVAYNSTADKFVITYKSTNEYAACVVATVTGTTVTTGAEVVYRSAITYEPRVAYDESADKMVFVWTDNTAGNQLLAIHGVLSGDAVSFSGSTTSSVGGIGSPRGIVYFPPDNRTIVLHRSNSDGAGRVYALSVSGANFSVTGGTQVTNSVGYTGSLAYSSASSRFLVANRDSNSYWNCRLGNLSGGSFTLGTTVFIDSQIITGDGSCIYDPGNDKFITTYQRGSDGYVYAAPVTVTNVSTNAISAGTPTAVIQVSTSYSKSVFDTVASKALILASNALTGRAVVASISGSTVVNLHPSGPLNWDTWTTGNTTGQGFGVAYSPNSKNALVSYGTGYSSTSSGVAFVNTPLFSEASIPTVNSKSNFIGIAQTTVASGSAVQVRLPGSYDQNNTGLTTGAVYYVDPTTSGFTTTATQPSAWSGAVSWGPVGRAVNSTTLLLTDMI